MTAYPGRHYGACTFAVFFKLVDNARKARAIADGTYDSELQRQDAVARANREIVIKRHFPSFFSEDLPEELEM